MRPGRSGTVAWMTRRPASSGGASRRSVAAWIASATNAMPRRAGGTPGGLGPVWVGPSPTATHGAPASPSRAGARRVHVASPDVTVSAAAPLGSTATSVVIERGRWTVPSTATSSAIHGPGRSRLGPPLRTVPRYPNVWA